MSKTKTIQIRVTVEMYAWLVAQAKGESLSTVIRPILNKAMETSNN